jgi:hypothetical protein
VRLRSFVSQPLLLAVAIGCGDEENPPVEIHARGNVDAFGTVGETTFTARYSSTLDDGTCEILDEMSGCALTRCTPDEAAPFEDAGEVIVGDHALDIAKDSSYSLVVPEELVPGEILGLSASGSSVVPEHESEVVVPERATITGPSITEPLVLDPTTDFVLDLEPAQSDRVVFSMSSGNLEISCAVAGSTTSITVASHLIAVLPTDAPAAFRIINENLVDSSVSGWRVWFGANQVIAEGTAELAASQ